METILRQLADLLLQAVPTVLILFAFFLFMRSFFFRPLERVLIEREARTRGARHEAEQAQAAALEATREYEEAIRKAKTAVYAEEERARRVLLDERAAAVREARNRWSELVRRERASMEDDLTRARQELEQEGIALGGELARVILKRGRTSGRESRVPDEVQ